MPGLDGSLKHAGPLFQRARPGLPSGSGTARTQPASARAWDAVWIDHQRV